MGQINKTQSFEYDASEKRLTVRGAESFPQEVFDYADEVEILDMSHGHLSSLPDDIRRLTKLRVVFFSHNDFTEIPSALSECHSLEMVGFKSCKITSFPDHALPVGIRGIILTDNKLTELPASIGEYGNLQKLMIAGNMLQTLPEEMVNCKNLQLIRAPLNKFSQTPSFVFQLPKLGWYTDSGNPFHKNNGLNVNIQEIPWENIALGEELGKGTSSTVYTAKLNGTDDVAVKIYKKGMISDGSPRDDMNACLLAGENPYIVGGIGKLINIPDEGQGLVMPLVPQEFKKLGNPPDLKTFTRDVYPEAEKFSLSYVQHILRDVASAMCHLHSKGIMHGDIYAHNILTNDQGRSYLGDFGAASLYAPGSEEGKLYERIDVRGFGYLALDLLAFCRAADSKNLYSQIQSLLEKCLSFNLENVPSFAEVQEHLL